MICFHFHKKHDYDTSGYKQASEKNNEDGGSLYRNLEIWKQLGHLFIIIPQNKPPKPSQNHGHREGVLVFSVTFYHQGWGKGDRGDFFGESPMCIRAETASVTI